MIQLRPYEPRDAYTIISWIGDEVAFRKWCADRYETYPNTADDMNRQYDAADHDRFFPMTAYDEYGIVGHLILRCTDEEKHILRLGFIIIDGKKRGRGIGGQMLISAIQYAFECLGAEKITLGVFENNPFEYSCYRSVGFREIETDKAEYYRVFDEEWKSPKNSCNPIAESSYFIFIQKDLKYGTVCVVCLILQNFPLIN